MTAPFGIPLGSSPNVLNATYGVAFHNVPSFHPKFSTVLGRWAPDIGLFEIVGYSRIYKNGPLSLGIRSDLETIKTDLEHHYGSFETLDYEQCENILDNGMDFFLAGALVERIFCAYWTRENGAKLPDDLNYISLSIEALAYPEARICLTYASRRNDFEWKNTL